MKVFKSVEFIRKQILLLALVVLGGNYHCYFDIIKDNLLATIQSFFNGQDMSRYMTYACLILFPKLYHRNKLKDFRLILPINFSNKIISKIISTRLDPILPTLICDNYFLFCDGKENI